MLEKEKSMGKKDVFKAVDHTILGQGTTLEEVKKIIDEGISYQTASVCIPPSHVREAARYADGKIEICTVIGFPNGYNTTQVKCYETEVAIKEGATEIDMVINIGWLKEGRYDDIKNEIIAIKEICKEKILKVIIETCLLTEEEKIKMCQIVTEARADYIKTSTGFSTSGATFEDIELFANYVGDGIKIKAAGGITSFEDAEKFMELGTNRLGTSRIVKLAKQEQAEEGTY